MIELNVMDPQNIERTKAYNKSVGTINFSVIRERLFSRLKAQTLQQIMQTKTVTKDPIDAMLFDHLAQMVKNQIVKPGLGLLLSDVESRASAYTLIRETLAITETKDMMRSISVENIKATQFYQALSTYTPTEPTKTWKSMSSTERWKKQNALIKELQLLAETGNKKDKTAAAKMLVAITDWEVNADAAEKFVQYIKNKTGLPDVSSDDLIRVKPLDIKEKEFASDRLWAEIRADLNTVEINDKPESSMQLLAALQKQRFEGGFETDDVPTRVITLYDKMVSVSQRGPGLPLDAINRKKFHKLLLATYSSICAIYDTKDENGVPNDIVAISLMYIFSYYLNIKASDSNPLPKVTRISASTGWAAVLKIWALKLAGWYTLFTQIPMSILYEETAIDTQEVRDFMATAYLTDLEIATLNQAQTKCNAEASDILLNGIREVIQQEYVNYKHARGFDNILPPKMIELLWKYEPKLKPSDKTSGEIEELFQITMATSLTSKVLPTTRPKAYRGVCQAVTDMRNSLSIFRNVMEYLMLNYAGTARQAPVNEISIDDDGKTFRSLSQPDYWNFEKQNPHCFVLRKFKEDVWMNGPIKTQEAGQYFKPLWRSNFRKPVTENSFAPGEGCYYLRGLNLPHIYAQFNEFYNQPVPYNFVSVANRDALMANFETLADITNNLHFGWSSEDKYIKAAKILSSANRFEAQALADILAATLLCYVAPAEPDDDWTKDTDVQFDDLQNYVVGRSVPGPKYRHGSSFFSKETDADEKKVKVKYWNDVAILKDNEMTLKDLNELKWRFVVPTLPTIYGRPTREFCAANAPHNYTYDSLFDRYRIYQVINFEGRKYYVAFVMHSVIPNMATSIKGIWETVDMGIAIVPFAADNMSKAVDISRISDAFRDDVRNMYAGSWMSDNKIPVMTGLKSETDPTDGDTTFSITFDKVEVSEEASDFYSMANHVCDAVNKGITDAKVYSPLYRFYATSTVICPHMRLRPQKFAADISDLWNSCFAKLMYRIDEYDLIETVKVNTDRLIMLDRTDYEAVIKGADHPLLSGSVDISDEGLKIQHSKSGDPNSPGKDEKVTATDLIPASGEDQPSKPVLVSGAAIYPVINPDKDSRDEGKGVELQKPAGEDAAKKPDADTIEDGAVKPGVQAGLAGDAAAETTANAAAAVPAASSEEQKEIDAQAENQQTKDEDRKKKKRSGKQKADDEPDSEQEI